MSAPDTPSKEKSFSSEIVAVLTATLLKKDSKHSFNYADMSTMSSLTSNPLTKAAIDHQFRAVKKRALELIEMEREMREKGGVVEEVKAGTKRAASSTAANSRDGSPTPAPKKARTAKGKKTVKREDDEEDHKGASGEMMV